MPKVSRRQFLLGAATTGLALMLGHRGLRGAQAKRFGRPAASIPANRVVHTHCSYATNWDYATGWYGDYVFQAGVNLMTDLGVMNLTGTATLADAWQAIIPYVAGDKVAIKINLNNATCDDSDQVIDALPQPINSVIRGLKAIGIPEDHVWVYDVTHGWHNGEMPARLVAKVTALYPGVQFHSNESGCSTALGYSATEKVQFSVPPGSPAIADRPICEALVQAAHLINMPIMKKHGMAGVTLGFKNHFGSIDGCDQVHWSVDLGDPGYLSSYSGLVDIFHNTHFRNKTRLTIGDGLFGARINNYDEVPSPWPTFGNQSPNSLFFSLDPVAIDCVMYDFLEAEGGVPDGSDNYLKLAATAGFGTFDHRTAPGQYPTIDCHRIEADLPVQVFLPLVRRGR